MTQSNFVDNVNRHDSTQIHDDIIPNSDMIADMANSHSFADRHPSSCEIGLGAGYTIRLEHDKKLLYRDGVKCPSGTPAEKVIADINQYRGCNTSRIGINFSENYGLHMSPDRSFQVYKRIQYPSSEDEDGHDGVPKRR